MEEEVNQAYGFEFPKEIYEIARIAKKMKPDDPTSAFSAGEGNPMFITLIGAFEICLYMYMCNDPDKPVKTAPCGSINWGPDHKMTEVEEGLPKNFYPVMADFLQSIYWGFLIEDLDKPTKYQVISYDYGYSEVINHHSSLLEAIKFQFKNAKELAQSQAKDIGEEQEIDDLKNLLELEQKFHQFVK